MTDAERQIFRMLERQMAANPTGLTPEKLRVYRALLTKQVSEMILTMAQDAPGQREAGLFDLCLPQGSELQPLRST